MYAAALQPGTPPPAREEAGQGADEQLASGCGSTLTLPTMLAEGAMKQLSLMAGALLGRPITSRCRLTVTREIQLRSAQ